MRGMGNMQSMMNQMKKLQRQMEEAQANLNQQTFIGQAQSGLVEVTMNGKREVVHVTIKPEVVDPEEVELLEDLVLMAVQDALAKVEAANDQTMGKFTKGMNIPGL